MTSTPNAVDPPSNGSRHDLENGGGDIQNLSEEVGETPQLSFGMSVALLVVATAVSVSAAHSLPVADSFLV